MAWEDALSGNNAWVVTLFKVTLSDSTVEYWTTHDQNYTYDSHSYVSVPGLKHTPIPKSSSSLATEVSILMPCDNSYFTNFTANGFSNLRTLDGATIQIRQCQKTTPANTRVVFDGYFAGGKRTAVLIRMDFKDILNSKMRIIPKYTFGPLCDKEFGSTACGVCLAAVKVTTGSADASTTATVILDAGFVQADDWFTGGYIQMTSGNTSGEKRYIIKYTTGSFTLESALSDTPEVGDTFTAYPHCRKTYAGCNNFSNTDNFFGFQYVPREEEIYAGM